MTTTILLARHAEVHNPTGVLYGRLPGFGLSDEGWRQAERLSAALLVEPIAAIYTSPLLRARQTAEVIARNHPRAPLRRSALITEVFTSWQGSPASKLFSVTFYDPPKLSTDESMFHIARRMRRFVGRMVRRHPGETVAAVSHGDAISIYLMTLRGAELSEKQLRQSRTDYPDRASINKLEFDDFGALLSRTYTRPK